jgi:drug/metabolite transporter (DMT)-like permease
METNLIGYVEPVVATGLSWLLLERTVGPATLLGFLVIFAGFLAVKRRAARALATAGLRHARRHLAPR